MEQQKITAIVGLNGSGKTRFVEQLRKQTASAGVRYIAFCDTYGVATDRAYYLQLRWNQHDIDKETPCVGELLERAYMQTGEDNESRRHLRNELLTLFEFEPLLNKYIITLSSGELRKFQLIKTLLANPQILILDNPFIGLDAQTRQQLHQLLPLLVKQQGIHIYIVVARQEDVPPYVDEKIWITPEADFNAPPHHLDEERRQAILSLDSSLHTPSIPDRWSPTRSLSTLHEIVNFHQVSIRYGERTILHNVDWIIKRGECWALSGQNGSGKSTLLSLICADNPQAYACDIRLFGHQRGSGESIWEIKRRIGYVSPEMHRSYQHNIPALQVVASGLKDTVGLYTRVNKSEREQCLWWMRIFGIEDFADRLFLKLSSGEQRLVLLARAFVKAPQLLILDEPLHGLDSQNRQIVKDVIQTYSQLTGKTIIMVTHYEEELPTCFTLRKQLGNASGRVQR